jgi:Bacterial conjugation TrbI-like protein
MSQQLNDEELWGLLNTDPTTPQSNPGRSATATLIQPDPPPSPQMVSSIAATSDLDDDLDDDDDFDDDLQSQRTLPSFAGSPLARVGLLGSVGLVIIIAIGAVIGGFQGQVKDASQKDQQASSNPTQFASPTVAAQTPGDGNLKAQMAFQDQKNAANPDIKATPPPAPVIKATPTSAANTASPPPPPPAPVPVAVSPAPIVESPPPPMAASPIPVSPIPLANLPPIDPNKAWNDLAQSATYGSLPVMITPPLPPAPVAITTPAPKLQTPQSDMGGLPSLSSYQLQSSNPSRKLRIGTQVKATLLNPIAWSGDGKDVAFSGNGAPTPKFIARLEQPLKDSDGNEVVPQGAEIVVAVRSLEPRSGMAELTALQMIIDNQEYAPPIGAITLRGANGNPLIADKFQDKGKDIGAADRSMFFFGALSKVGELLNRTDSNVVITAGGSSSSSSSGKPNVLGGILQGGFGALAQQQQQRNQQWLQEIIQRPDIRYIPAGKELSLYINQTVAL